MALLFFPPKYPSKTRQFCLLLPQHRKELGDNKKIMRFAWGRPLKLCISSRIAVADSGPCARALTNDGFQLGIHKQREVSSSTAPSGNARTSHKQDKSLIRTHHFQQEH